MCGRSRWPSACRCPRAASSPSGPTTSLHPRLRAPGLPGVLSCGFLPLPDGAARGGLRPQPKRPLAGPMAPGGSSSAHLVWAAPPEPSADCSCRGPRTRGVRAWVLFLCSLAVFPHQQVKQKQIPRRTHCVSGETFLGTSLAGHPASWGCCSDRGCPSEEAQLQELKQQRLQ